MRSSTNDRYSTLPHRSSSSNSNRYTNSGVGTMGSIGTDCKTALSRFDQLTLDDRRSGRLSAGKMTFYYV